jgi:hypothetical protein
MMMNLDTIDPHLLSAICGGQSAESDAMKQVAADRAAALEKYNRAPDTAAGQTVADLFGAVGVDGAAAHRALRGITEGTSFDGVLKPAY